MIQIHFYRTEDSLKLTMQGHAGYAEKGQDIVCAAVTAEAYTLAQAICDYDGSGFLDGDPEICMEEGNVCIACKPRPEAMAMISHDYFVIARGLQLLSTTYGDYISISVFGQDDMS